MAVLVPASGELLERILDETFPQWGEGLDRAAYARYNAAQLATPWGTAHLRRVALVEGRDLLATAKVYRLRARLDGREIDLAGLGAVFTPARLRRRGHAADLIRQVLAGAAADGCGAALLFSEISPSYYERFGFRTVPVPQFLLDAGGGGAGRRALLAPRAIAMRSGDSGDLRAVAEMNALQAAGSRLSLARDPGYIAYAHAKKRLLAACGLPGHRQVEFMVVEEGGRAAAYAVILEVGSYWMVTECGDRDPSGARVGAILQSMLARAGRPPQLRAWLPPGLLPPQLSVLRREIPSIAMMVAPLGGLPLPPLSAADVCWWHADAF